MNLAVKLEEAGVLKKHHVKLLGTSVETIQKGEDREQFRALMKELDQPVPKAKSSTTKKTPSVSLSLSDFRSF